MPSFTSTPVRALALVLTVFVTSSLGLRALRDVQWRSDAAPASPSRPVVVFAAVSTNEAICELADRFRTETGIAVQCNLAASSALARQLSAGAWTRT